MIIFIQLYTVDQGIMCNLMVILYIHDITTRDSPGFDMCIKKQIKRNEELPSSITMSFELEELTVGGKGGGGGDHACLAVR